MKTEQAVTGWDVDEIRTINKHKGHWYVLNRGISRCSSCSLFVVQSREDCLHFPHLPTTSFSPTNTSQERSISTRSFSSNQELCFQNKEAVRMLLGEQSPKGKHC